MCCLAVERVGGWRHGARIRIFSSSLLGKGLELRGRHPHLARVPLAHMTSAPSKYLCYRKIPALLRVSVEVLSVPSVFGALALRFTKVGSIPLVVQGAGMVRPHPPSETKRAKS